MTHLRRPLEPGHGHHGAHGELTGLVPKLGEPRNTVKGDHTIGPHEAESHQGQERGPAGDDAGVPSGLAEQAESVVEGSGRVELERRQAHAVRPSVARPPAPPPRSSRTRCSDRGSRTAPGARWPRWGSCSRRAGHARPGALRECSNRTDRSEPRERVLEGVRLAGAGIGEPLHRGQLAAIEPRGQGEAGPYRRAVEEHGAGAAHPLSTAVLRAVEGEAVAQEIDDGPVIWRLGAARASVQEEREPHAALSMARRTASRTRRRTRPP